MKSHNSVMKVLGCALLAAVIGGFVPGAMADLVTLYWDIGGTARWDVATNWDPEQVPTAVDDVEINQGRAEITDADAEAREVRLGYASETAGELYIDGYDLDATVLRLGRYGAGTVIQDSGTVGPSTTIQLAMEASGEGRYELNGGVLLASSLNVGGAGTGSFIQTGGSVATQHHGAYIGYNDGSTGYYELSGGSLVHDGANEYVVLGRTSGSRGTFSLSGTGYLESPTENVGWEGIGVFVQTGGTNNVTDALYLGRWLTGSGSYSLSGDGYLSAVNEYIGYRSTIANDFVQTGGTNAVSGDLYLAGGTVTGYVPRGSYSLSAGTLTVGDDEYMGYNGAATFTQTGGLHQVTGTLSVGYSVGSTGLYELLGGTLETPRLNVGANPPGRMVQTGGYNSVGGTVYLGEQGKYYLSGGTCVLDVLIKAHSGTPLFSFTGGTLVPGTVGFDLGNNGGVLSPDGEDDVGTVAFGSNDYTQGSTGVYYVDITSDRQHDQINSTGDLTFDGTVYVNLVGDFSPSSVWSGNQDFYIAISDSGKVTKNVNLVTDGEHWQFVLHVVDIGGGKDALRLRWVDTSCE